MRLVVFGRREHRPATFGWESLLYLLIAISQGLSLLLLGSNACQNNPLVQLQDGILTNVTFPGTYSISTGAKLTISSTVFFFVSAVTSFMAHKAEKEERVEEARDGLSEPLTA